MATGDKISADKAKEIYDEKLKTDSTRKHILGIVRGYTNQVEFMEKVQKYAGKEIDARIFTSWKYWAATVGSAAITGAIGFIIAKLG